MTAYFLRGIYKNSKLIVENFCTVCPIEKSIILGRSHINQVKNSFSNSLVFSVNYSIYVSRPIKMASDKPKVVFVLGGPGAGKGTQCQRIVEKYGFVHLSAGDLLREEQAKEGSEFGQLIAERIKNGKIVPVEITCSLLENAINGNVTKFGKTKFLIDGFPRNQNNLDGWSKKMSEKVDLLFILFFDCPEGLCVERCLSRGKSSGRSDDNEESLKKRIHTYQNDSLPIIEFYKKINLVRSIDASPSADEVFAKVQEAFEALPDTI